MIYAFLIIAMLLNKLSFATSIQSERYPQKVWQQYDFPEQAGFICERLDKVKKFYDKKDFAGLLVIKNGAIVIDWGQNNRRFPTHSVRKSMLSALFGIHSSDIDFKASLIDLNINDNSLLTETEQKATLFDVLASRSGVYLSSAAESEQMTNDRPQRGSHLPGTHWWYNNWDFNVAGTIYNQLTGEEIFESFNKHFAVPLQMQDYRSIDGYYVKGESEHQAFQFRMSSRDLARIGLLFARKGTWGEQQVIPHEWVELSTKEWSKTNKGDKSPSRYGLMWWIEEGEGFSARGAGGHVLAVYPNRDLIVVLRTNTYLEKSVSTKSIKKILEGILSASQGNLSASPALSASSEVPVITNKLPSRYKFGNANVVLDIGQLISLNSKGETLFINFGMGEMDLTYLKENKFIITDRQEPLDIELDNSGKLKDIKTPRIFYLQAAYAAKQGDFITAKKMVKKVIELTPDSAIAYTNLAKILIAEGRKSEAKLQLNIALNLDRKNKQANALNQTLLINQWLVPATVTLTFLILLAVLIYLKNHKCSLHVSTR